MLSLIWRRRRLLMRNEVGFGNWQWPLADSHQGDEHLNPSGKEARFCWLHNQEQILSAPSSYPQWDLSSANILTWLCVTLHREPGQVPTLWCTELLHSGGLSHDNRWICYLLCLGKRGCWPSRGISQLYLTLTLWLHFIMLFTCLHASFLDQAIRHSLVWSLPPASTLHFW